VEQHADELRRSNEERAIYVPDAVPRAQVFTQTQVCFENRSLSIHIQRRSFRLERAGQLVDDTQFSLILFVLDIDVCRHSIVLCIVSVSNNSSVPTALRASLAAMQKQAPAG
jgi:hypothetical protein